MRSAVRFPIKLPVDVQKESVVQPGETQDISSGGVLFSVDTDMAVGSIIEFCINMPAHVLGTAADVKVKCVGRVVRCSSEGARSAVAAVIDEYHFERG
jgi:PilZ domain-containing protein